MEMLVAMTVLALLIALVSVAIIESSRTFQRSDRALEGIAATRFVLDFIGDDLNARVNRADVPLGLTKEVGNDSLVFYGERPSATPTGARGISLISYRVDETNADTIYQLRRAAVGTSWSAPDQVPFVVPNQVTSVSAPAEEAFDILSDSVFRIEFSFIYLDGSVNKSPPQSPGSFQDQVKGIVVTVAALAPDARKPLGNPASELAALSDAFPDAVDGETPITAWKQIANDASPLGNKTGLPPTVIPSIKIDERVFYVR